MTFPSSPFPHQHVIATCTDCEADYCFACRETEHEGSHWYDYSARIAKCGECDPSFLFCEAPCVALIESDRFPILRSEPLWRQTWVSLTVAHYAAVKYRRSSGEWVTVGVGERGYWFPPLSCGPNAFGDPRKKFAAGNARNWRLYSVDNCPACLADLQAIELMVYGLAYEIQQWPDDWEHRCWFGRGECVCGNPETFTNLAQWRQDVDHIVHDWFVWESSLGV